MPQNLRSGGGGLLRVRSQGRNFSIRGIDNQRGSARRHDLGSALKPEVIISPSYIGFGICAAAISIRVFERPAFKFGSFLFC